MFPYIDDLSLTLISVIGFGTDSILIQYVPSQLMFQTGEYSVGVLTFSGCCVN